MTVAMYVAKFYMVKALYLLFGKHVSHASLTELCTITVYPIHLQEFYDICMKIWQDKGVMECYGRSNEYQLIDCAP